MSENDFLIMILDREIKSLREEADDIVSRLAASSNDNDPRMNCWGWVYCPTWYEACHE